MTLKIVAEIGVNYVPDSSYNAQTYIKYAAKAGCDYVKFQLFNKTTIKDSPIKKQLEKYILTERNVKQLKAIANKEKIGFILTPMYNDAVAIAEEYADLIKIRYKDNENEELINLALDTGKDLIISVSKPPLFRGGATTINMVNPHIYPIYCLPRYPPIPEDFCLDTACATKGFSSHFPYTIFDIAFAINRMFEDSFIEKHFMLEAPASDYLKVDGQPMTITPTPIDASVSITFDEMTKFIEQLNLLNLIRRIRM